MLKKYFGSVPLAHWLRGCAEPAPLLPGSSSVPLTQACGILGNPVSPQPGSKQHCDIVETFLWVTEYFLEVPRWGGEEPSSAE